MNPNPKFLVILLVVGVFCLVLGIYLYIQPPKVVAVQQEVKAETHPEPAIVVPEVRTFFIHHTEIVASTWTGVAGVDPEWSGHLGHAFGGGTGFMVFYLDLPAVPTKNSILTAQLSAEMYKVLSDDPRIMSDVQLFINNVPQGVQRVMADNGVGTEYSWKLRNCWQVGSNKIAFQVRDGMENGLCVYRSIQVRFQ